MLTAAQKFLESSALMAETNLQSNNEAQQQQLAVMIGNAVASAIGPTGSSPTIIPMSGNTGGSSYQNGTSQLRQQNA